MRWPRQQSPTFCTKAQRSRTSVPTSTSRSAPGPTTALSGRSIKPAKHVLDDLDAAEVDVAGRHLRPQREDGLRDGVEHGEEDTRGRAQILHEAVLRGPLHHLAKRDAESLCRLGVRVDARVHVVPGGAVDLLRDSRSVAGLRLLGRRLDGGRPPRDRRGLQASPDRLPARQFRTGPPPSGPGHVPLRAHLRGPEGQVTRHTARVPPLSSLRPSRRAAC